MSVFAEMHKYVQAAIFMVTVKQLNHKFSIIAGVPVCCFHIRVIRVLLENVMFVLWVTFCVFISVFCSCVSKKKARK